MRRISLPLLVLMAFVATTAHAQGGCVNSPENPSAILALVGTAAYFFSAKRRR